MALLQFSVLTDEYFSVFLLLKYGYCYQFFVNKRLVIPFVCTFIVVVQ